MEYQRDNKKVIPKHPNYIVYENGYVARILTPGVYSTLIPDLSNGYPRVELDGKKEYISKLVLETFDPQPDKRLKVFHIDGDRMNCKLNNLVWLTPSEVQLYSSYTVEYRRKIFGRVRD